MTIRTVVAVFAILLNWYLIYLFIKTKGTNVRVFKWLVAVSAYNIVTGLLSLLGV